MRSRGRTVILFCVRVPVLSLHITVAAPRVSISSVRLIKTLCSASRCAVSVSTAATVVGRPSGTLATSTRMKALTIEKTMPSPRPRPMVRKVTPVTPASAATM